MVSIHTFGPVKQMQTTIGLPAQLSSMRSIIGATQQEQRHGLTYKLRIAHAHAQRPVTMVLFT